MELDHCNGADATVISDTHCAVPKLSLRSAPFNLPWGSSIYVKVIAYNNYGDSLESSVGNGAIILTNPDAPVNVIEVYSERTATTLGLTWSNGAANGGAAVLDFTVSSDSGTSGATYSVV